MDFRRLGIQYAKQGKPATRQLLVSIFTSHVCCCLVVVCICWNFDCCVTFAGIKNVAFFFSAITAQGQSKTRGKKYATAQDDSDSNGEEISTSQVASSASQEWLLNHQTVVDDKLRPTINYWIALTTPNGAPANPIQIHRALLDKGVEITALQVHDFYATKRLVKILLKNKKTTSDKYLFLLYTFTHRYLATKEKCRLQ